MKKLKIKKIRLVPGSEQTHLANMLGGGWVCRRGGGAVTNGSTIWCEGSVCCFLI
jgi:hypothetical protein